MNCFRASPKVMNKNTIKYKIEASKPERNQLKKKGRTKLIQLEICSCEMMNVNIDESSSETKQNVFNEKQ